jgi:hypothetical protein
MILVARITGRGHGGTVASMSTQVIALFFFFLSLFFKTLFFYLLLLIAMIPN